MKKTLLRIAFLLLSAASASAQSNYSVQLQAEAFTPTANGTAIEQPSPTEMVGGHYYRCIQFWAIPSEESKADLKTKGITLHNYLPSATYTARIPAGFNFASLGAQASAIRAVFPLGAARKMSADLARRKYPSHALQPGGFIELTVAQQPGLAVAEVAAWLQRDGATLLSSLEAIGAHHITVPVDRVTDIAALPYIAFAEAAEPEPVPENLGGRTSHRSNTLATEYATGLKYDGTGVTVALNDDGNIGPHIDYAGRIAAQYVAPDYGSHGDHCAGIIFGAGNRNPMARGMAFGATLRVYRAGGGGPSGYQGFDSVYQHYANLGVRITSTSYGQALNGGYTTSARLMDVTINEMPSLMHVFSAGNSGTGGSPANWYNITGGHKVAKNVIAVGNLDSLDNLATSSSRGPASDGRIKPDVCAVGTSVLSTVSDLGPNSYANYTGTSMACPGVAGTLAQLYHAWRSTHGGADPRSALIKAALMNTADDLGNPGPDFKHGYGRINARRAWALLQNNSFFHDSLSQGGSKTHTVTVPAGAQELRVMLYWHDTAATAGAAKALVNNLDLKVTTPSSSVVLPWKLTPSTNATILNQLAFQGVDSLNNVEQITIPAPAAGSYTVSVTGPVVPFGPQDYHIVYEVVGGSVTLTHPQGGESLVPGVSETIRWDAYGSSGTFSLEYSTNGGTTWNSVASGIAATQRHYNWVPPAVPTGQALVRVTRGAVSDASDASFTIIGVPSGLTVDWVCVDSMKVSYTAVTGAARYIVSVLGTKYMDSAATSTTTSCVVRGLNTLASNWWSVQAVPAVSGKGRRAIAQQTPVVSAITNTPLTGTLACGGTAIQLVANPSYYSGVTQLANESFNTGFGTFTRVIGAQNTSGDWLRYPGAYGSFTSNDNSPFLMVNSDSLGNAAIQHLGLVSPAYSTLGQSSAAVVLDHFYRYWNTDDTTALQASTNGTTWTTVMDYKALGSNRGTSTQFARDTISLPAAFVNQSTVYVRIVYRTDYGYYWAVNNFRLIGFVPGAATWSPTSGLFTNAAATIPYTGAATTTVFAKPSNNITYIAAGPVMNGVCPPAPGSTTIFVSGAPSTLANNSGAVDTTLSTQNLAIVMLRNDDCELLAILAQSGASPVSGNVHTRVTIDGTVQLANGQPYVQRHVDINPTANASTATATVVLYATQAEFNNYNAVAVPLGYPALPTNGVDNGNVRITKFSGASATYTPGSYTPGTTTLIVPATVSWNTTNSRWEISFPVAGFGGFFIHSGAAVPLTLTGISIAAANEGAKNRVTWQAAGEEGNGLRYVLERSVDGHNFSVIENREAAGTTGTAYVHYDLSPVTGANYYRVRSTDGAGRTVISPTATAFVASKVSAFALQAFPNPLAAGGESRLTVRVLGAAGSNARMVLLDVAGKMLQQKALNTATSEVFFDMRQLPGGIYTIRYTDDTRTERVKVTKQ